MKMTDRIVEVEETTVACDGYGPYNGHPRVYIKLNEKEPTACPYCSRLFIWVKRKRD